MAILTEHHHGAEIVGVEENRAAPTAAVFAGTAAPGFGGVKLMMHC